jgi:Fe2+ or Zn2+ uptake regulation protein
MKIRDAVRFLRARGYKMTDQRREILRALIASKDPMTAQEVLEEVQFRYPRLSLDTVYRNLLMLTTAGLVNQVNLQVKGVARFEYQGDGHHHHVVCLGCSRSFCMDNCPMPATVAKPEGDPHFQYVTHAFELYGYCSKCQAAGMSAAG